MGVKSAPREVKRGNKTELVTYPQKLKTFRLTSFDRAVLDQAAKLYGGQVVECPKDSQLEGQWELITEKAELPIYVASHAPSQWLEHWEGRRCQRRCDGEMEMLSGRPCICNMTNKKLCKPTTRFGVVLYELPGMGVWRIESRGWNVAAELMSTVEMLLRYLGEAKAPLPVKLAMEERKGTFEDKRETKTSKFMVCVIRVPYTPQQILEMGAQAQRAALEARTNEQTSAPALKQHNPRGHYWGLHAEACYPHHDTDRTEIKAINYRVWSRALGREITSASHLTDADYEKLVAILLRMSEGESAEPEEWAAWREGKHPLQELRGK